MLSIIRNKDTKKFALITFDDIPESVFTNAYPILKKYNIPFTIFVAIKYIGEKGFISKEQFVYNRGAYNNSYPSEKSQL